MSNPTVRRMCPCPLQPSRPILNVWSLWWGVGIFVWMNSVCTNSGGTALGVGRPRVSMNLISSLPHTSTGAMLVIGGEDIQVVGNGDVVEDVGGQVSLWTMDGDWDVSPWANVCGWTRIIVCHGAHVITSVQTHLICCLTYLFHGVVMHGCVMPTRCVMLTRLMASMPLTSTCLPTTPYSRFTYVACSACIIQGQPTNLFNNFQGINIASVNLDFVIIFNCDSTC